MKPRLGLLVQAAAAIRDSVKAPFWGSRVDKSTASGLGVLGSNPGSFTGKVI